MTALGEEPGRSQFGSILTRWWLDHNQKDLFSVVFQEKIEDRLQAVIDANVFFDLVGPETQEGAESRALKADWLQDELTLCVTDEINNEINRQEDSLKRKSGWGRVSYFPMAKCSVKESQAIYSKIRKLWPKKLSERDQSDIRQVAKAVACQAAFFITRDNTVLDKAEAIKRQYNVLILRPNEVIVRIDELQSEYKYQPVRLASTLLSLVRIGRGKEDELANGFMASDKGERRGEFRGVVRNILAKPKENDILSVKDSDGTSIALIGIERQKRDFIKIVLFRVIKNNLAATLTRHLVQHVLMIAKEEGRSIVAFSDKFISQDLQEALLECKFTNISGEWFKYCVIGVNSIDTVRVNLANAFKEKPSLHVCATFLTA